MFKRKKITLCLTAAVACLVSVAAVGCTNEAHTHTYSEEWAFDAEAHWRPAACDHDVKADLSAHVYETTVIPPTETSEGYTLHLCSCGYSYVDGKTDPLPSQTAEEYRYNAEGHWKPVLGGGEAEVQPHVYEDETVAPTCTRAGYVRHACACGYWYASDPAAPIAHTPSRTWGHNEGSHWLLCAVCGGRVGAEAHDFEERVTPASCETAGYTDFVCECGYSFRGRETAAGHTYAQELTGDEYEHWRPATCDHASERADVAEHVLTGGSNVCEVCGKAVTRRLAYRPSDTGDGYVVTGVGCVEGGAIEIPDLYREKPVLEVAARAFKNLPIVSVSFGKNVEKIGAEAFAGTQIGVLELSDNVKEIGAKAFAGTRLTSVALGASVQTIGQGAFRDCSELSRAEFRSEASLPSYLFEGCGALSEVVCAKAAAEVGARAFAGTALKTFDLSQCKKVGFAAFCDCASFAPQSLSALESAEEYAFSGCAVTAVDLPSLSTVADRLFYGCKSLERASLCASSVGVSAFEDCSALGSVSLSGTRTVGENAFAGCAALSSLELPETVERVGANAFSETKLVSEEGGAYYAANVLIGAAADARSIAVKAGTAGVADEAFGNASGGTALESVTFTNGVRFIGVNAFRGCTALSAVEFPESVTLIGANAFRGSGLVRVTVPATVQTVGDNAFYDCMGLTYVSVSAKEIGKFAFSYTGVNRSLEEPVKQRPEGAKLKEIVLGAGVETIGSNAFQYCPVGQISLPESLVSIGKYAFAQTDLTAVEIPAAVERIGEYAFYGAKLSSAVFRNGEGWKAGKTAVRLGSPAENAKALSESDIDWVRG